MGALQAVEVARPPLASFGRQRDSNALTSDDANSAEGRNPLYRIAGRPEPEEEEPKRNYASWMLE